MNYRIFGKTGEKVSVLGFGCMRLPIINGDPKNVNIPETTRMIDHAIDRGVNYFDTAYVYHQGNGEKALAQALANGKREKIFLATKLPVWNVNEHEDMEKILDEQLKTFNTDCIDFYLVHSLNKNYWSKLVNLDLFKFLDQAKKKGKVKHLGFSFHDDYEQFTKVVDSYPWEFCQIQYNYLDENYQAGKKGLQYAKSKGLGVSIMEPLRGGVLANKLCPEAKDVIQNAPFCINPAELALKWVWSHSEVSVVLSGMTEMEHVIDNIHYSKESEKQLTDEETRIIKAIQKVYKDKIKINCTGCKYCIPCPAGVDIPQCFELYNKAFMLDDASGPRFWYNRLSKASNCTGCGNCEDKCPQNLEIINNLKAVTELFESSNEVRV